MMLFLSIIALYNILNLILSKGTILMTKAKARGITAIFAIIIVSCVIASMCIKPYGGELSLFHVFAPYCVGLWLSELIDKFYQWLCKKTEK